MPALDRRDRRPSRSRAATARSSGAIGSGSMVAGGVEAGAAAAAVARLPGDAAPAQRRAERFGAARLEAGARRAAAPEVRCRAARARAARCGSALPGFARAARAACRSSRRRARRRHRPGRLRGSRRRRCGWPRRGRGRGALRSPAAADATVAPAPSPRGRSVAIASTHSGGRAFDSIRSSAVVRARRAAQLGPHPLDRPAGEVDAVERERAAHRRVGGAAEAPAAFAAPHAPAARGAAPRPAARRRCAVGPAAFDPARSRRSVPASGRRARRAACRGACSSGARRASCGALDARAASVLRRRSAASCPGRGARLPAATQLDASAWRRRRCWRSSPRPAAARRRAGCRRAPASPCRASPRAAGTPSRVLAAGRSSSNSPFAFRRLAPRASSESAAPGHHGAGSKSTSAARARGVPGRVALARLSRPASVARAAPRLASARAQLELARAAARLEADPRGLRRGPRQAAIGEPAGEVGAQLDPGARRRVAAAKPVPTAASLPSSAVSGARASSADGLSCVELELDVPAIGGPAAAARRSCRRRAGSSRARRRASAPRSFPGRRDGRAARRRAAAPAAGLRSSGRRGRCADRATISAGRSRPLVVAVARPLRLVAGASLAKAERSSASVDACSSPSGQAANGRTTAFASSDCAAWAVAGGDPRASRATASAASGPVGARARLPRRRGRRPRRR